MSTTTSQSGPITKTATAASIAENLVVKMDTDAKISVATATNTEKLLGTTISPVATSGNGAVNLFNEGGTLEVVLAATATIDDRLYPAAGGKVSSTEVTNMQLGIANQSGVLDDHIEMIIDRSSTTND